MQLSFSLEFNNYNNKDYSVIDVEVASWNFNKKFI